MGEKEDGKSKSSPTGDRPRGVVCEEESGDQEEGGNEWYVEARRRAHARKERQGSVSDGKGVEEKAIKQGDESKTKEK